MVVGVDSFIILLCGKCCFDSSLADFLYSQFTIFTSGWSEELKVNRSFILAILWKINRDVGCCPGLILMQYAVLHFVLRSTKLTRALWSVSKFSAFSIDIVDGFGEGTVQLFCGSASFIVVTSQSAYAITVACASCPACI